MCHKYVASATPHLERRTKHIVKHRKCDALKRETNLLHVNWSSFIGNYIKANEVKEHTSKKSTGGVGSLTDGKRLENLIEYVTFIELFQYAFL